MTSPDNREGQNFLDPNSKKSYSEVGSRLGFRCVLGAWQQQGNLMFGGQLLAALRSCAAPTSARRRRSVAAPSWPRHQGTAAPLRGTAASSSRTYARTYVIIH